MMVAWLSNVEEEQTEIYHFTLKQHSRVTLHANLCLLTIVHHRLMLFCPAGLHVVVV